MHIRSILLPVDFTSCTDAATAAASLFAERFDAKITLVHVVQVPLYPGLTLLPIPDILGQIETAAREGLDAAAARLAHLSVVGTALRRGVIWEQILMAADEVEADLIVMGTHGREGIARALMGSVTEKIVRMARAPVMTIHAKPNAQRFVSETAKRSGDVDLSLPD
jgi:nucleotide-binding universal stress UspA family protein